MTLEALPEVAKVAAEVRGYASLTTSFLLLGDRLVEERRLLDAAFCYRAAEFFLLPGDERRARLGSVSSTWFGRRTAFCPRTTPHV